MCKCKDFNSTDVSKIINKFKEYLEKCIQHHNQEVKIAILEKRLVEQKLDVYQRILGVLLDIEDEVHDD